MSWYSGDIHDSLLELMASIKSSMYDICLYHLFGINKNMSFVLKAYDYYFLWCDSNKLKISATNMAPFYYTPLRTFNDKTYYFTGYLLILVVLYNA